MRKVFYHILFLFALLQQLNAQTYYSWQLSEKDGLTSMEIYYLFQDSKAYVWVATDKGLSRYDGHQFEYFQHPQQKGQAVTEIREDQNGQIWYRNFAGQLFYINSKDSVQLVSMPEKFKLSAYSSYYILENKLYAAGNYLGVYDILQDKWKLDTLPKAAPQKTASRSIANITAIQNSLYFINYSGELWKREQGKYELLGTKGLMVISALGNDSLVCVSTDFSQKYYISSLNTINQWNDVLYMIIF